MVLSPSTFATGLQFMEPVTRNRRRAHSISGAPLRCCSKEDDDISVAEEQFCHAPVYETRPGSRCYVGSSWIENPAASPCDSRALVSHPERDSLRVIRTSLRCFVSYWHSRSFRSPMTPIRTSST